MITNSIHGTQDVAAQSTATQSNSQSAPAGIDGLANEQTFLKLLVAQIRNQDPLQPQDATQFVAQLAQFSSLEQQIQMRQDLDIMSKPPAPPPTTGTPTTSQQ